MADAPKIPVYQKYGPGGRYARVRIDGKDIALGRYGTEESRRQYDQIVADWLGRGRQSATSLAPRIDVGDLARRYMTYAVETYRKRGKATKTVDRVEKVLIDLAVAFGDLPAADFGLPELKALRQSWIARKTLSRTTINDRVFIVCRAWRWAAEEGLVPPERWWALKALRPLKADGRLAREPRKVLPVPQDDLEKAREAARAVIRDMIDLQILTGMRPGEVSGLRREEVDVEGRTITIPPERNKTAHQGKDRVVRFGPRAAAILKRYLDQEGPLFLLNGKPMSYTRYYNQIRITCDRARITRWHPNRLRHNHATAVRARYGAEAARIALGHTKLSTTEIYAERDEQAIRKVVEEIG